MNTAAETTRQNLILNLQDILYEHPLYELLDPNTDERQIRLLVVGFAGYGREFTDLCLQAGQMDGYTIAVTALSDDPDRECADYLNARPDLARFVNVNGSMDGDDRAYGILQTIPFPDTGSEDETDAGPLRSILASSMAKGRSFDYIFIDRGTDAANQKSALLCAEQTANQKNRCPVCYVCRKHTASSGLEVLSDRLIPVSAVPEELREGPCQSDADPRTLRGLDREAFCVHLSWLGSVNYDIQEEYREFCSCTYNYISSRAFALSIRYKLYSVGIILKADCRFSDMGSFFVAENEAEAAGAYADRLLKEKDTNKNTRKRFNRLVALEHKRWVLSLVTDGWTAPRDQKGRLDLSDCVAKRKVKNSDKKTHPCLVFSTAATPLKNPSYEKSGRAKWEKPVDPSLDELDRMSVELHQLFRAAADQKRKKKPLESKAIRRIDEACLSFRNEKALRAFKEFKYCLNNILNGNIPYTRQYETFRNQFTAALAHDADAAAVTEQIHKYLEQIDADFFCIREANLYRDYKEYDTTLVQNIPFILTWQPCPSIAMAFEDGRFDDGKNEKIFSNVAAATILQPSAIRYFYFFDQHSDQNLLCEKIAGVQNYLVHRGIRTRLQVTAACTSTLSKKKITQLNNQLQKIQSGAACASGVQIQIDPVRVCANAADAAGFFCEELAQDPPDLFDGSTQLFTSAKANALFLQKLADTGLPYFEFDWRHRTFTECDRCSYLRYAIDQSFLRVNDMFALMNAEVSSEKIMQEAGFPDFPDNFDRLWNIYQENYDVNPASWQLLCSHTGKKNCKELIAKDVKVKDDHMKALLADLQKAGFIKNLNVSDNPDYSPDLKPDDENAFLYTAGFQFTSFSVKNIFEKDGQILEVYAYHEALKTGYFDDVATDYKYDWESASDDFSNELDLVVTKGFHSIIVECKAAKTLQDNYYYKLQAVTENCGVGLSLAILGKVRKSPGPNVQSRGKEMHITTISDPGQINNVGKILQDLMEQSL